MRNPVVSISFLQLAEENFGEGGGCRRKQPDVKQFVRLWISSGVQPELLVVDLNYRLICRVE